METDRFLTRLLGPFMTGLADAGEVGEWYFARSADGRVTVRACSVDPPVLRARLTGLVLAASHAGRPGPGLPPRFSMDTSGRTDADPAEDSRCRELFSRMTPMVLAAVAESSQRLPRLRLAVRVRTVAVTPVDGVAADRDATGCVDLFTSMRPDERSDAVRFIDGQLGLTSWEQRLVRAACASGRSRRHHPRAAGGRTAVRHS